MKGRSTINGQTESPCEVAVLFPSCSTFTTATPEDIIDQWSGPTIHCWTRVPWGGEYVFTPLQSWFDIKYFPQSLGEVNCSDWPPHKGKESPKHSRKFLFKREVLMMIMIIKKMPPPHLWKESWSKETCHDYKDQWHNNYTKVKIINTKAVMKMICF